MAHALAPMDGTGQAVPRTGQQGLWELQGDLATVSCYAATEIDDLLLGRPSGFDAVRHLVEILRSSLVSVADPASPRSLMDPTTAVAMNHAIVDSDPQMKAPLKTITEVVREAKRISEGLSAIAEEQPKTVASERRVEVERLRSLCLALANRALAFEEPLDEQEPEPEES